MSDRKLSELETAIAARVLAVESAKLRQVVVHPGGQNPKCMPVVGGSGICERCGEKIVNLSLPCPAVPPERRWDIEAND